MGVFLHRHRVVEGLLLVDDFQSFAFSLTKTAHLARVERL